jgi:hypothetical protein
VVEVEVVVEPVVLVVVSIAVAVAVAPFSPSVSPLALSASPGVPATSARVYPPWCLPSVALSASGQKLRDQLWLVEAMEDPSQLVVVGVVKGN